MLLEDKVAIISGIGPGLGQELAYVFAREGARLVLTDIDDTAGIALAEKLGATYLHHDVSEEDGWPAVIETAERLGRLDIMVANAGIGIMGTAIDMSLKDWRRQMAINVDGVFLSVKYCIPAVLRCRHPRIGRPGRLQRHQGRRPPVRQVDGDGVRTRQ